MPSSKPFPVTRNLRATTSATQADLHPNEHAKPDTRRFAGIFPQEITEAIPTGDATDEGGLHDAKSDKPSRWELVAALDKRASTAPEASTDSSLSAAQQVAASYRAVHGIDHRSGCAAEISEKELPKIPDDQRSMFTLATSGDAQSTMDMTWRPKPKIHMHRRDQQALVQAQSQAIEMMQNAGLKPTNKIQCRRRGCADILPNVEALKYHLHIHNIADGPKEASLAAVRKHSVAEGSSPNSKASKQSHSRSISSSGIQHQHPTALRSPSKQPSAGSLLPSLFSPRENAPEGQHVSSIATVAHALVSDSTPSKPCSPSVRDNHATPSRGRRTRKESAAASVGAECSPSIAMLLSPPSSPTMHGRLVTIQHTNLPVLLVLNPSADSDHDNPVVVSSGNGHSISETLTRARSPRRALSPTRALSPIRDGIKRVLTIGRSDDFIDD